jgi:hypothetical protein
MARSVRTVLVGHLVDAAPAVCGVLGFERAARGMKIACLRGK